MQILVIGAGYVGLVVAACLAETGNDVACADIDAQKIDLLRRNVLPLYEPGLDELVRRNQEQHRLCFTADPRTAAADADVVFLAVGTPPGEDGSADLRHVLAAAAQVAPALGREAVIITKSTVPVGTAARVRDVIEARSLFPVHVCSNPEFLKEGAAVDDFMRPDRVVLGVDSDYARSVLAELYAPFVRTGKPILFMDVPSAELTKYAANAMLATRISFMNEIALLCEVLGANIDHVRRGVGLDARIGPAYLFPGPGYGGSCFPKDVKALLHTSRASGVTLHVAAAAEAANVRQRGVLFAKLVQLLGPRLAGLHVGVWGLAFKPRTDDLREAPALDLIANLLEAGAEVAAHDPVAMEVARARLGGRVALVESCYDAVAGADALVVVTDWNEYRNPDFRRMREAMARPLVLDGRNLYDPSRLASLGFVYASIGRSTVGARRADGAVTTPYTLPGVEREHACAS